MAPFRAGVGVTRKDFDHYIYDEKWAYARQHFSFVARPTISRNALKFVKKAKEDLDLDFFPVAHNLIHGYIQLSCGAWSVCYYTDYFRQVGTNESLRNLARSCNPARNEVLTIGHDDTIYIEKRKK